MSVRSTGILPASAAANTLPASTAFSTTIPLTGNLYMPKQTISAATTFAPSANPVPGASVIVDLIGDGSHTPTFAGFTEAGSSAGWNAGSGIINTVTFSYNGSSGTAYFSIQQPVPASGTGATVAAQSAQVGTSATNLTIAVSSTTLNTGIVPAASAFSVADSATAQTVSSVAVTASGIALTLSPGVASTDTGITVTYTQPATNPVQDTNGNKLSSVSALAVTNNVAAAVASNANGNAIRLATSGGLVESANAATSGFYDYTGTATNTSYAAGDQSGVSLKTIPAGADGFFGGIVNTASADMVFGVSTNGSSIYAGIYINGSVYTTTGSATAGTSTSVAAGDLLRFRRTGSTLVFEVSKNSGSSYATVATVTGSTSALYMALSLSKTNAVKQVFGSASMQ